jgi:glutamyl-tRNA reductase
LDQRKKICSNIHALKAKLNDIKNSELNFQSKKIADFNESKPKLLAQESFKNYHQFANHLKDDDTMVDESIEWIEKVFKIGLAAK